MVSTATMQPMGASPQVLKVQTDRYSVVLILTSQWVGTTQLPIRIGSSMPSSSSAFGAQRLNLVRFAMNSMVGASKFVTAADYISEIGKTMPALNAVGKQ